MRVAALALAALAVLSTRALAAASPAPIALVYERLELDGLPVVTYTVDLDRDGVGDLAVVTAATRWGEIGVEDATGLDASGVLVEVLTVVPALFDRHALLVFRGRAAGGFEPAPLRLELPESVHALERGAAAHPLLALTDDGVARVALDPAGALALVPLVALPHLLAGATTFVPRPDLAHDLDGDGDLDLVLPTDGGLALLLAGPDGLAATPVALLAPPLEERLPGDARHYDLGFARHVPLPVVGDLDGDGRPDLLWRGHEGGWQRARISYGTGGGRFGPPVDPLAGRPADAVAQVAWIGDLDGDARAEIVTAESLDGEPASLRATLRAGKRPRFRYTIHRPGAGGAWSPAAAATFTAEGYLFAGESDSPLPGGARDLDGDGRLDLVTVTLDFSLFELARVAAARSIRIGFEFAVLCQRPVLDFRPVAGVALTAELKVRLERVALGELSSFGGDFDGDGRADFLQLGRGRAVAIHRGGAGCRYAAAPDAVVELAREPLDLALVAVGDLDGDGRSDLAITQPGADANRSAALDLYLSRGVAP